MITPKNLTKFESEILSLINKGFTKFETILKESTLGESTLLDTLSHMVSKNYIFLNPETNEYSHKEPLRNELVILDGNLMLPTTILRYPDKILVGRGEWYEFPADFDVRAIIWNVKLGGRTNSTLVELLESSIMKEQKSRIVQDPKYSTLIKKLIPFNDKVVFVLNKIGTEVTAITVKFKIRVGSSEKHFSWNTGFSVDTEISSKELFDELGADMHLRDYERINVNRVYNFSDFIKKDLQLPIKIVEDVLYFVKVASLRGGFKLEYYTQDVYGTTKLLTDETVEGLDAKDALDLLRETFEDMPVRILNEAGFECNTIE